MVTPNNTPIALVSAGMLVPFISAVNTAGGDHRKILKAVGLPETALEQNMLPAKKAWEFLEVAAAELSDPHFGFQVGHCTPMQNFQNLRALKKDDITLGQRLSKLVVDSKRMTNQANYTLTHDADTATLKQNRRFAPLSPPTQSDGFSAGFIIRLARNATGPFWSALDMRLRVCEKSAIPGSVIPSRSLIAGGQQGVSFQFPSEWLLLGNEGTYDRNLRTDTQLSFEFLSAFRRELRNNLGNPKLSLSEVAKVFSFSDRSLQEALGTLGTTFRVELAQEREDLARRLLATTNTSIADVGKKAGHPVPSSFTRAFKSWTGHTPTKYRALCSNASGADEGMHEPGTS